MKLDDVQNGCDALLFMDEGVIVEEGAPHIMFRAPAQERTRAFLRAVLER